MIAPTRMAMMIPGMVTPLLTMSWGRPATAPTPRNVPSTMPISAPNADTMIASQRTDAPRLALVHPDGPQQPDLPRPLEHTERQRDRDAEHGDKMAKANNMEMTISSWSIWSSWSRGTRLGLHLRLRELGHGFDRPRPAAGRPLGQPGDDEEVAGGWWLPAEGVEADQPVAERAVAVDARHGQVDLVPFWNVAVTVEPT